MDKKNLYSENIIVSLWNNLTMDAEDGCRWSNSTSTGVMVAAGFAAVYPADDDDDDDGDDDDDNDYLYEDIEDACGMAWHACGSLVLLADMMTLAMKYEYDSKVTSFYLELGKFNMECLSCAFFVWLGYKKTAESVQSS